MRTDHDHDGDDEVDLTRLSQWLKRPTFPAQMTIAKELDVDQPFISRARTGRLKRVTVRVENLWKYARIRIELEERAGSAAQDIDAELGTDQGEAASLTSKQARQRGPANRLEPDSDKMAEYRRDAISGVRAYLDDGLDPRLLVEQLAVLRRAQRRRLPGRRPREEASPDIT